jgi:hypothetical protein
MEVLNQAPVHGTETLCANSRGLTWTEAGCRAAWAALRSRLTSSGQIGTGLTLSGLRYTLAVILRESGHDERAIADALGQKTIEMARHDAKGADLTRRMRGGVDTLDAEVNKRHAKGPRASQASGIQDVSFVKPRPTVSNLAAPRP